MPRPSPRSLVFIGLTTPALAAAIIVGCAGPSTPNPAAAPLASAARPLDLPTSPQWITFHDDADALVASFPADARPHRVDDSVDTPIRDQSIVRYMADDGGLTFDAGYLVRTSSPLALLAGERRILTSASEGTAKHVGGTLRASTPCVVDGHDGCDLEIALPADADHPDGRFAMARLVMTDHRIMHAIVHDTNDEASRERARHFIEALHPAGG